MSEAYGGNPLRPSTKLRIALIAPMVTPIAEPYVGGMQSMLADLAQGLVKRGHRVTLFAREGSVLADVPIEQLAVPAIVRPSDFSSPRSIGVVDIGFAEQCNIFLQLFLDLCRRQDDFDIVHAHAFDWPSFALSTLVDRIPVLHTIQLPPVIPEINEALRILHLQRDGRALPVRLITASRSCARTYEPYTTFDYIIPNGVDLAAIPFISTSSDDAPLLFAGRITPEKGVEEAIEIARLVGRPLLIAGGIYDQRYYEQRILPRLQQESEHITYLGQLRHADLWELMGKAYALLFPIAWDEPFGLVPVEAMATGTPVIAFRRGAMEEVILHGETGFLVEPGDCVAAAAYVSQIGQLLRSRCRAHVEANFSVEHIVETYEQVYLSLY
jgi:UDP-glucose:tetrahydrobiopterin glucosyltransferase